MKIDKAEFNARRENLLNSISPDSVIILASSKPKQRVSDTEYSYRQDSNFYYLCGFDEPDSLIVLRSSAREKRFVMFCRDRDPLKEQWDGNRAGKEGLLSDYQVDQAYSISEADKVIPELMEGSKNIYILMSSPCGVDKRVKKWISSIKANTRSGSESPTNILSLDSILDEMRLIKTEKEIEVMRKAADITTEAHINAMKSVKPGMYEYQLEAEYIHTFMKNGARFPAYNSIVGGGNNACILHYIDNNCLLNDNELVLVDAGCEYDYYAADVTRTFPVNGKFSEEQKLIYEIVLEAHRQSMEEMKPGNPWNRVHEKSIEVLSEGLIELGLLNGTKEEVISNGNYSKFYMHKIGHWLGMDVHDVGNYKKDGKWVSFKPGMVMTIEPGIYILDTLDVDDKWKGIGVRIEDDVLVTESGFEIITPDAPRTVEDIESLMH